MSHPLNIIIVERLGALKLLAIKEFKEEELFKKCGFKKAEDFVKQVEWKVKCDGNAYIINVFAKTEGRPNSENKYDFPPPIDTKLFFGSCAIVASIINEDGKKIFTNLSLALWNKIYEKLFGGFEDLGIAADEDENEVDELANVSKDKKTKHGYLKDGFIVVSSDADEDISSTSEDEDDEDEDEDDVENKDLIEDDIILEDIGSELSEESYDYDSETNNDNK
jgi:hypothetical protein